jgi:hypothetical protein
VSATASAHDLPATVRPISDSLPHPGPKPVPPPTPAPAPHPAPRDASGWLLDRIAMDNDTTPRSSFLSWLCAQRAITALEIAEQANAAGEFERCYSMASVADQYRQIAALCSEGVGMVAPPPPENTGRA